MLREENVGMAEEYFNNSLALEPDNRTALFNLGTLLMQQGDLTGALKKYKVIMSKQPDNFDALFNSGLCHLYRENKEAAAAFFIQAADLRPNDGQAQYLAGEMLLQLGQARKALPYFRLAYKENPGHFETTQGFAISLLQTESYNEAVVVCDAALLNFGAATLPLQVKGDAMLALGRYEEAVMCHIDLCNLDLDIRDFVIARLQRLATADPAAFMAYSTAVHDLFPSFESILKTVQTKE
jgi:tetratricopeptide (TPR) repeat protein